MTRTPVRSTLTAACLAALSLLAACSSSSGGAGSSTTTSTTTTPASSGSSSRASSSAPARTSAAAPTVVQHSLPPASAIKNSVTKRKSVTLSRCAATSGGWQASGTAHNATKKPARYVITVFFTTKGATVMDYARTAVSVRAGRTATWRAAASFAGQRTTLCVLRGVG